MYCKHCGNQIADNSVFCHNCGKLVVDAYPHHISQSPSSNESRWISTDNLQWKKPIAARQTQIIIIVILGLLSLYPLFCFISGGEAREYYSDSGYYKHEVHVNDPLELKILKFTSVKLYNWRSDGDFFAEIILGYTYNSKTDVQNVFRAKMFLVLFPLIVLILLTIRWMKWTRFPGEKDIVPRDVADEIEQYEWDGFTKYKFVFYKKDGKYGVIDARNYFVNIQAQYDSIAWRIPNKTIDVTIGEEKRTIAIKKWTNYYNPNKFK